MNQDIANILKDRVKTLPWVDKISGLIREYTKVDLITRDEKQYTVRKVFPVSCDVDEVACLGGAYKDLAPDSRRRSVVYFECGGCRLVERQGDMFFYKSTLRMVAWVNMRKFSDYYTCSVSSRLVQSVLALLPITEFNEEPFQRIKFEAVSELPKNAQIFSRYTYDEALGQYLIFPYDYFALQIETTFRMHNMCIQQIELADATCP